MPKLLRRRVIAVLASVGFLIGVGCSDDDRREPPDAARDAGSGDAASPGNNGEAHRGCISDEMCRTPEFDYLYKDWTKAWCQKTDNGGTYCTECLTSEACGESYYCKDQKYCVEIVPEDPDAQRPAPDMDMGPYTLPDGDIDGPGPDGG